MAEGDAPDAESTEDVTDETPEVEVDLLHGVPVSASRGQVVLHPDREGYLELIETLATDGYGVCIDLCGVDALTNSTRELPATVEPQRFEVVVNLLDMGERRRVRVRVQLPEDDPSVATITQLHPGAEAMEREAMDMFGITFDEHPDPTRILLPEDWVGHPLRKDYSMGRIPVQFKAVEGR